MKKWFLLLPLLVQAYVPYSIPGYCLCDWGAGCAGFITGLYWAPWAIRRPYAIENSSALEFKTEPAGGFQLGASLTSVNHLNFARGAFIYFDSRNVVAVTGSLTPLTPFTTEPVAKINGRRFLRNRSGYLVGGRYLYLNNDFHLALFGGVRYAYLEEYYAINAFNQRLTFQGAGPEIGLQAESARCAGLFFTGRLSLFGLIGPRDDRSVNEKKAVFQTARHSVCVPGVVVRLGLGYVRSLRQVRLSVEGGYELDTYFQAIVGNVPYATTTINTVRYNLGFGGPYLELTMRF